MVVIRLDKDKAKRKVFKEVIKEEHEGSSGGEDSAEAESNRQ